MEKHILQMNAIEGQLKPETDIEHKLINHPDFMKGLFWGQPRYGHPEGKIIYHIAEVLKNIDQLNINLHTRQQLRLIAFLHDTFKYLEDTKRPRDWSRHHSILSLNFAKQFIEDEVVLKIIEHHDEAFYSWRMQYVFNKIVEGEKRIEKLKKNMGDDLQIFYLFFKCDTRTGDKNQKPLNWFEATIQNIEIVKL